MWISLWRTWLGVSDTALAASACACLATLAVTLVLIRLAPRLGLMDQPDGRKTHAAPTPVIGGLGIALGCIPVAMCVFPAGRPLEALAIASVMLLITGVADDLYDLRWQYRFCAQVAAALVLVYFGGVRVNSIGTALGVDGHTLGILSAPFTVLATAGVINAINMSDGVDGLAGSIGMAALAMAAAAAIYAKNTGLAIGLVLLMGGVAAFLALNLRAPWNPRARTFLGNAGSEFLGLVIAWACFRLTQTPDHPVTPVLAPFLISAPLIDCLVLMAHRIRRGRSPFSADRDHLHHLLIDAGFSISGVIFIIVAECLAIGLLAGLALLRHPAQPLFVVCFLALAAGHFAVTAHRPRAVRIFSGLARIAGGAGANRRGLNWATTTAGGEFPNGRPHATD
jgi:UDP-GlcNAc:undecaprenyl-phosphate GlcNAc-1-phosphate transferase